MTWEPTTIPANIITQIDGGGEQARKPMEQRMREASFSDDPTTVLFGDHMRLSFAIPAWRLKLDDPPAMHALSAFGAMLFRPPEQDFHILLFTVGFFGGQPRTVEEMISTDDDGIAKEAAELVIRNHLNGMLADIERIIEAASD